MALTAEDIQAASDVATKYVGELDDLAKANGIDVKVAGNDPADLLKASGAGLATGAAVGAAIGAAFPPFAPFTAAAGAIIGAIAGFFAKFHFGPSAEQQQLAAEWDKLNATIAALLATVPEPMRAQLGHIIIEQLRRSPGPLPFCLPAAEGGCVSTSMQGLRDAAAGIDQELRDLVAQAQTQQAQASASRRLRWGLGLAAGAGIAYAGWHYLKGSRR
jgi:hypothetical protein